MCWVGPSSGCCGYGRPTDDSERQPFERRPEATPERRDAHRTAADGHIDRNDENAPLLNSAGGEHAETSVRNGSVAQRLSRLLPAAFRRVLPSRLTTSCENGASSREPMPSGLQHENGRQTSNGYGSASSAERRAATATGRSGYSDDSRQSSYQSKASNSSFLKPSLPSTSTESLAVAESSTAAAAATDSRQPALPVAPPQPAFVAQLLPPPAYQYPNPYPAFAFAAQSAAPNGAGDTRSQLQTQTQQSRAFGYGYVHEHTNGSAQQQQQWMRPQLLLAPETHAAQQRDGASDQQEAYRKHIQDARYWGASEPTRVQPSDQSRPAYFSQSHDAL